MITTTHELNQISTPIKILYVIDTLEVGGAERSLLLTTQQLDKNRFESTVCRMYEGGALDDDFQAAGVRVRNLDLPEKYHFVRAFRKLRQVVKEERPSLIHTTLFRADQVGRAVAKWCGVPVVSSFVNISYDSARTVDNPHVNPRKLGVLKRIDQWTARWVTRFHSVSKAVSQSNCDQLKVDSRRVTVVPRGRETNLQKAPCDNRAQRLRRELDLENAYPVILNVGRLVDQKGQRYLIEAMGKVLSRFSNARLLIAGDGNLRNELSRVAETCRVSSAVQFLGHRSDVADLLHVADYFVFPSIYEGLPGALVEAMIGGCPVVASDIDVIREVVDEGETGLLFPAKNATALADAIIRLAGDRSLADRLARNGQAAARQRFDIRTVAQQMESLYIDVLTETERPQ